MTGIVTIITLNVLDIANIGDMTMTITVTSVDALLLCTNAAMIIEKIDIQEVVVAGSRSGILM
ncbi:MAG: hypothetical protein ABJA67_09595 [Chthonomonadales bacterium]